MTGPEREHMPDLPVCLEELYENFSLIRNEKAVVFKARQKSSGLPVLIKITVDEAEKEQFQNEYQLLRRIETECSRQDSSLFPRAVQFFEAVGESNQAAIVREFVSGFTVEQLVDMCKARPGLSEEKTLQIGKDVLRMLRILHTMHPPVIHRDIKPQNVVMDSNGQCHLIDFGISRCFSEDGAQDTNVMGTRLTAPPEQFGYRQTDQRSDIYSVGVLLRFCLTGEYLERADAMICKEIRQIIARATQFDPNNRYPGADKMLAAIERATDEEKRKEFLRKMGIRSATVLAVLLCFCFLIAGAQWHPAVSSSGEAYAGPGKIHFREPLIEQAVRTLLNKSETPLSKEDLALVTSLHIFGKQIYTAENQIDFLGQFVWMKDPAMNSSGLFKENGGIVSLDDLALLPNLQELYLYGQSIEDISALKDTKIARIGIGHNPLTDLSPIRDNLAIRELNLSCLPITDLNDITGLANLESLNISGTQIMDLGPLEQLKIRELNIFDIPLLDEKTLSGLSVQSLTINKLTTGILDACSQIGDLRELTVTHANGLSVREIECIPSLQKLFYYTDEPMSVENRPLHFPEMHWIDLKNLHLLSLDCVSEMPELETLLIYASQCESYAGLDNLSRLSLICCTAEQAAQLQKLYPSAKWAYDYVQ